MTSLGKFFPSKKQNNLSDNLFIVMVRFSTNMQSNYISL